MNEDNLKELLVQTISADNASRKNAEAYIRSIESQPGFLVILLQLINRLSSSADIKDVSIRQSASVLFKNVIKRKWSPDEDSTENPIVFNDRETIKTHLIDVMCSTSSDVQKQLAEAVSIVAKYDFPAQWKNLLPQLVSKLTSNQSIPDLNMRKGVMVTANSIMKRYRFLYKNDALFAEILECLQGFQVPLLETYKLNSQTIDAVQNDKSQLLVAMETHRLMTRIFFSLNWQDLPEFFEDHINEWMTEFAKYLAYKNPILLNPNEDTEPGPIESLQTAIVENLNLYANKYEEEFKPFLGPFTQAIWGLLMEVGPQPKYDHLTSSSIKFLTSVGSKQMNIPLFTDAILKDIVEHIVIKNLMATENDEEIFEDNPTDYIRKDMEGGDQDTRRRSAMELIRALLKFFPTQISQLCKDYINVMLEQYRVQMNWRAKDAALHLVLSATVMSTSTTLGAGTLNPNFQILDIFNSHVLPEVHDTDVNARPIVKADAIKLICFFRTHLQTPFLLSLLPHIIRHLTSKYVVVQTYAAVCIERFLSIKDKNAITGENMIRITKQDLTPFLQPLLTGLFAVLDNPDLPENDYVMKCIMKVLPVIGTDVLPLVGPVMSKLTTALARVCAKPMNPHFNHYLFESLAVLVKSVCIDTKATSSTAEISAIYLQFESLVFPPFQSVLNQDVTEFIPYVFQVLALLLSARPPASGLSDSYKALFPPLLSPVLWKQRGYVPALSDLFKAYIITGMSDILIGKHLEGILGIFQELLSVKVHETYAFRLINQLYKNIALIDANGLSPYIFTILDLQLRRMKLMMKDSKTPKYCRLFIHSLFLYSTVYGSNALYNILDKMDPGLLVELITNVWTHNRLACTHLEMIEIQELVVGATKMLCDSPITTSQPLVWCEILKSLLPLLEAKGLQMIDLDDTFFIDEEAEDREFDTKYSKLVYAQVPDNIPTVEVAQFKSFFATSLSNLCAMRPGQYLSIIQQGMTPDEQNTLQVMLQQHGVSLS